MSTLFGMSFRLYRGIVPLSKIVKSLLRLLLMLVFAATKRPVNSRLVLLYW